MKTRKLGNSGIEVGPLALGGNVFGWTADESTSFAVLDAFVAAGFNLIDTADMYSVWVPGHQGGESETIIGNWLARSGRRSQVVIATKVGMELTPSDKGLSKPYILRAVERSLQRLKTDYIDLYQSHLDDASIPLAETLSAYDQLIKQGKVRAIGASNYTGSRLAEALHTSREKGYPGYECLQPHYNLCERQPFEKDLEPVCREAGLAVIPYFSLAAGFLTGKYRSEQDLSKSPRGKGLKKYLNERGFRILAALDQVASRLGSTPGKVALAWLMSRPSVTAPIASATSLAQLGELIDATKLQLDREAVVLLDQASM
jgi:aryl-alcohol dehydrogenase-like predicted oxidoreductase